MTRPTLGFDKASVRAFIPSGQRPTVYRLYNDDGDLVYLGASAWPRKRLLAHLRDGKPATTVTVEFHRTTTAMARAEREALASETPLIDAGPARRHGTWNAQNR